MRGSFLNEQKKQLDFYKFCDTILIIIALINEYMFIRKDESDD